jgi:hypothetical protein
MRTLVTCLAVVCAITNTLLFCDWASRGEHALAVLALLLAGGLVGVALLAHRLRL